MDKPDTSTFLADDTDELQRFANGVDATVVQSKADTLTVADAAEGIDTPIARTAITELIHEQC